MGGAKGFERGALLLRGEVAGWIVGMHEDDGSRPGGDGCFQGVEIDRPAVA